MRESSQPGFTGTVWEAIPPEQLVQELTTGPGAMPMTEAGLSYGELAAGLNEAATEFRAVLSVLGDAWSSSSSTDGLNQLVALAEWLDRSAGSAQANAALAARQATAYQITRTTVPHLVDVAEAARVAEDLMRGSMIGGLLAGLLDTAEKQLDDIRQQAARAMRAYEADSEHLARPWQLDRAPEVSAAANLLAEQSNATSAPTHPLENTASAPALQHAVTDLPQLDITALHPIPAAPTMPVGSEALGLPALPLPGVTPTAPAPGQLVQSQAGATAPLVAPASAIASTAPTPTPTPAPAPTRSAGASDDSRAGNLVINAGFATAPAVLGADASTALRSVDPAMPKPESS